MERCLQLLLWANLMGPICCFWFKAQPVTEQFGVVPASILRKGQGLLDNFGSLAEAETFVQKVFGTDCYTDALRTLQVDCKRLTDDTKARLAMDLANCFLQRRGLPKITCKANNLQPCQRNVVEYQTFLEFFTNCDSICLFLQNQNFIASTELMLNTLQGSTRKAVDFLSFIHANLSDQQAEIQAVGKGIEELNFAQQEARESMNASLQALNTLENTTSILQQYSEQQLANEATLMTHQERLRKAMDTNFEHSHQLAEHNMEALKAAGNMMQTIQQLGQNHANQLGSVLDDMRTLEKHSQSLLQVMDMMNTVQQRSDNLLSMLVGKSFRMDGLVFYSVAALSSYAVGSYRTAAAARLPMLTVFGTGLATERMALGKVPGMLDVQQDGQVLLVVPPPAWVPHSIMKEPWATDFNWAVRKTCVFLAALILMWKLSTYCNLERESYMMLKQVQQQMRAAEERYRAALTEQRISILQEIDARLGPRTSPEKCAPSGGPSHRSDHKPIGQPQPSVAQHTTAGHLAPRLPIRGPPPQMSMQHSLDVSRDQPSPTIVLHLPHGMFMGAQAHAQPAVHAAGAMVIRDAGEEHTLGAAGAGSRRSGGKYQAADAVTTSNLNDGVFGMSKRPGLVMETSAELSPPRNRRKRGSTTDSVPASTADAVAMPEHPPARLTRQRSRAAADTATSPSAARVKRSRVSSAGISGRPGSAKHQRPSRRSTINSGE